MGVLFTLLVILFLIVAVSLVLIILVQRPQGGGLAQAFGGAGGGGTDTAFGGRTGDALTYATMTAFGIYLALAIALNILDLRMVKGAKEEKAAEQQAKQSAPATAPAGAPAAADSVKSTSTPTVELLPLENQSETAPATGVKVNGQPASNGVPMPGAAPTSAPAPAPAPAEPKKP